jgi:hypothetical protein
VSGNIYRREIAVTMAATSRPGALLIGRIDHIWDEWTSLSPKIALQVLPKYSEMLTPILIYVFLDIY